MSGGRDISVYRTSYSHALDHGRPSSGGDKDGGDRIVAAPVARLPCPYTADRGAASLPHRSPRRRSHRSSTRASRRLKTAPRQGAWNRRRCFRAGFGYPRQRARAHRVRRALAIRNVLGWSTVASRLRRGCCGRIAEPAAMIGGQSIEVSRRLLTDGQTRGRGCREARRRLLFDRVCCPRNVSEVHSYCRRRNRRCHDGHRTIGPLS